MQPIIGLLVVLGLVFGGYILAGGKIGIILKALPFELMMIGGGSTGGFIIANKGNVIKATLKDFKYAFKGSKWKGQDYKDLLSLLFILTKLMKTKGLIALESHIERPHESSIFAQYPKIAHDHFAADLICDTIRMMTMGVENPYTIEDIIEKKLEKHHHEANKPGHALQTVSDGLPAIGIVAAVLGVIKTMASINEPPEILGKMIGGALVGTFLGVFLSYCLVGPLASKILQVHDEDHQFYLIIRDVLVSHLKGSAPQISVEVGRGSIPSHFQPSFAEIEEATSQLKVEG